MYLNTIFEVGKLSNTVYKRGAKGIEVNFRIRYDRNDLDI